MDATQVLDFDDEEIASESSKKTVDLQLHKSSFDSRHNVPDLSPDCILCKTHSIFESTNRNVAFLKVSAVGEFPETLFPVYEGENIVGRHDNCDITIPLQAVSKKHACIDVHGKNHLICDYNSRNKTRRNQMFIKPQAFYELVDEVELMFADVKCQYLFAQTEEMAKDISDTGSETASESMMPQSADDDEQKQDGKERLPSSPENVKLEVSVEEYFDQPTQDYSYKNPDETSPVFCPETDDDETDDETDDEKDNKDDDTAGKGIVGSSFSTEQTMPYSPGGSGNELSLHTTMPYSTCTLPDTLEPDIIPDTPFAADIELPFTLKRAVDVKDDSSRRISAGNTLAYGLSTLGSLNSTRESIDVSEGDFTKEELSGEGSTLATPEVKNKLLFQDDAGQESPNNDEKRLTDSVSRQDTDLDDLLATQLYEPLEPLDIPESPEFLQQNNEPPEESTKVAEFKIPENIPQGKKLRDEIPESKSSEGETSESDMFEGKTFKSKISEGKSPEGKTSGGEIPDSETEETQACGLGSLANDENDDIATQAYGLTTYDSDSAALETGDELAATQAYGVGDDIEVPELSKVFKVPGAMNTQDMNEDGPELGEGKESNDNVESLRNKEYFDEMDIQPTQNYIENQDYDNEISSKLASEEGGEISETSDCNLPSLSSFMGFKSDSDSDFVTGRQSSKKKVDSKSLPESATSAVKKSPSVVIEGENAISSEKRCYVECPTAQGQTSQNKVQEETGARKKSVRGRKRSTAQRGKVQDDTLEDTGGLFSTPAKDDWLNEEATSSTRNDNLLPEYTDEQQDTVVVKRGRGRPRRARASATATRSSRTNLRGKKEDAVTEETEGTVKEDTASISKGRKTTRKRKMTDDGMPKTESKNEMERVIAKDDTETIKPEEKMHMSEDDEDNDMFKLQVSAADSPEPDDFLPIKKPVREAKRSVQRGKKGLKGNLEGNNGSEAANVVDETKRTEENVSVSTKFTRKGRAKKSQVVQEFDNNENMSEDVVKQDVMVDSRKDERRPSRRKDSVVKSTKKPMADQVSEVLADLQRMDEDVTTTDKDEQHEVASGATTESKAKKMECDTKFLGESTSTPPENIQDTSSIERMEEDFTGDVDEKMNDQNNRRKTGKEANTELVNQVESVNATTPDVSNRRRTGRKGKQTATRTSKNDASQVDQEVAKNESDELANSVNETEAKEQPKTTGRRRGRKRKSSETANEKVVQKKETAKKSRKNTATEENTEIKTDENEVNLSREATATLEDDTLKLDSQEPELPRSLSKRASSTASTTSTTSSSVSRSARKGKQQENIENELLEEKPTPRKSAAGRKKSTPATPASAKGGRSGARKKTNQESDLIEDISDQACDVKIIFTGLQDDAFTKAKKIVQVLGGKVVEHLEDCTHLVTDKVRRTVKLLCAVSRGIPVVDMSWLDASKKSKSFVDSSRFILKDKEAEKKFNFSMERSLELAQSAGLLDGYKIHVTQHVRPPPDHMKEIIMSAKGKIVPKMPQSNDKDVIVLSCEEDKSLCEKAHIEKVYTAELLLTGILRQELNLEQHELALNATPESAGKPKGRRRR